jgi:uncharacterized protein YutD
MTDYTYKWKYQALVDRVLAHVNTEELEAKLEKVIELKEKANELKFLESYIDTLTREHLRKVGELTNQQNKLAEELEDELKAFEAEQKVSEI